MQQGNHIDLDFVVSCASFHPTCRKVEIQYLSLQKLIESVSADLEQQYLDEKSRFEQAEKNVKDASREDDILYQYLYDKNCSPIDGFLSDLFDIQNMFYQSMLSTVFSFYESILTLIVVEKKLGDRKKPIDALKKTVYRKLPSNVQKLDTLQHWIVTNLIIPPKKNFNILHYRHRESTLKCWYA